MATDPTGKPGNEGTNTTGTVYATNNVQIQGNLSTIGNAKFSGNGGSTTSFVPTATDSAGNWTWQAGGGGGGGSSNYQTVFTGITVASNAIFDLAPLTNTLLSLGADGSITNAPPSSYNGLAWRLSGNSAAIAQYFGNTVTNGFLGTTDANAIILAQDSHVVGYLTNTGTSHGPDFIIGNMSGSGFQNTIGNDSGNADGNIIIGGIANIIGTSSHASASIVLGNFNSVDGAVGGVTIGTRNSISGGTACMVVGSQGVTTHTHSFVWSDLSGLGETFGDTGDRQFLIHALNGVGINTNNPNGAALNIAGSINIDDTLGSYNGNGSGLTNLQVNFAVIAKTGAYSALTSDTVINITNGGIVKLPSATVTKGKIYSVVNLGGGTTIITNNTGSQLFQYQFLALSNNVAGLATGLQSDGTNWNILWPQYTTSFYQGPNGNGSGLTGLPITTNYAPLSAMTLVISNETILQGGLATTVVAKSANYSIGSLDYTVIATNGCSLVTMPDATAATFTNRIFNIVNLNSAVNLVITNSSGSQLFAYTFKSLTNTVLNSTVQLQSDGTNWNILAPALWNGGTFFSGTTNGMIIVPITLANGVTFTNTNAYAITVQKSTANYGEAAVAGVCSLKVSITNNGVTSAFIVNQITALGGLTGAMTNSIPSFSLAPNGTVGYSDVSTGAGNTAVVSGGEYTYIAQLAVATSFQGSFTGNGGGLTNLQQTYPLSIYSGGPLSINAGLNYIGVPGASGAGIVAGGTTNNYKKLFVVSHAGYLTNLYVGWINFSGTSAVGTNNIVLMQKNSADTALSVNVPLQASGTYFSVSNLTQSATYAVNDTLCFEIVSTNLSTLGNQAFVIKADFVNTP